jgi:hypothetical protein
MVRTLLCDHSGVPAHTATSRPPSRSAPPMARAGTRLAVASLLDTPRGRAGVRPPDTGLPLARMGRLPHGQGACVRRDRGVPVPTASPIGVQGWHSTPGRLGHRRLEHAAGGLWRDPRPRRPHQQRGMGGSRSVQRDTITGHGLFPAMLSCARRCPSLPAPYCRRGPVPAQP